VPEKRRLSSGISRHLQLAAGVTATASGSAGRRELATRLNVPLQQVEAALSETFRQANAQAVAGLPQGTILRADPQFLEKALPRAADIVWQTRQRSGIGRDMREHVVAPMLTAALTAVVEGPVRSGVRVPQSLRIADILIGSDDDDPDRRAVVEVALPYPHELQGRLAQLDHSMSAFPAAHGALVVIGHSTTDTYLTRIQTPAGREVLLLQL
jgi:hypothetical protein